MLFHSQIFLFIFLPSVFCAYFLANKLTKIDTKIILIISGLIFYSWWNIYLSPLIIISIFLKTISSLFSLDVILQIKSKANDRFFN